MQSTDPNPKKQKVTKRIGTHNGTFHCDEALACFMLLSSKLFKDAELVRSREKSVLDGLDCVVDVGDVYDPSRHRYDHHQRGFNETLSDKHNTKLSSAGLIYKHFGKEIIKTQLGLDDGAVEIVYQRVYTDLIESLDAIDNGISATKEEPKYKITTDLSSRVKGLNPNWNEENVDIEVQFKKAMQLTGQEFLDKIIFFGKHWLPARNIVLQSFQQRTSHHPSGEIVVLDKFCPWNSHLLDIETESGLKGLTKYVLFQDNSGQWRVQAVSLDETSFVSRLPLPEPWRGKRDQELSQITNIPDCVFTHHSGFIGGNKTFEGVMKMAVLALNHKK
eukprot:TRINITY_DN124_c0_g1_i2.p1 TRINITY_DN124_c0_g1~~TRINITY_DN124_c0_g1_i2.p1  ORF type:complete len:332 (-),score=81.00 TRINITY_DN124_c0_g1_i2:26-1021(-)